MKKTVGTRVGEVAYSDTGTGPVLVLLHATLHDRRDFDAIAPELSREHRVIALDWPGHGESPFPETPFEPSAPLFADVLRDVVEALDLPAAVFLANSVGGFAAARLAITDPQRVAGLVLINNGGFFGDALTRLTCRLMGTPSVLRTILPLFVRSYLRSTSDNDRAVLNRVVLRARTRAGTDLTAALWRSFAAPEHDLRPDAHRITAPTLIVWGSKDTAAPVRYGRGTRDAIPGARLELLPTGHLPFSSDPAGFLAIVEPFLADTLHARTAT